MEHTPYSLGPSCISTLWGVPPTNCPTTDGTKLETLSSALVVGEPAHTEERRSWQRAAEMMIAAAENGHGIEDATKQIELALFLEAG
jgi:hypothetical protein